MLQKICIASGNPQKIREITNIIKALNLNVQISSIQGLNVPEPDEPHDTFMENARHKAQYYAQFTKLPTLSEDAGLCIVALDGFPGVKTKDFMIESGGLENSFLELEKMLSAKNNHDAYFVCAAVLYIPDEQRFIMYEGRDHGKMSFPARGGDCFGFDPVFIPNGYTNTMAELGEELKNSISHRGIAIRGVLNELISIES